jgi:hypothetical protein
MVQTYPNRIAGLLEVPEPQPVRRTPAQQAAARINGSKSRGPRTVRGRARSSLNALKHGLLAKTITPSADPRGDDRLYRRVLAELNREFRPRSFSDECTVASLASDYVQLCRARNMIEEIQMPHLAADELKKWTATREAEDRRLLLKNIEAECKSRKLRSRSAKVARELEASIRRFLENLKEAFVDEPTPDVLTPEQEYLRAAMQIPSPKAEPGKPRPVLSPEDPDRIKAREERNARLKAQAEQDCRDERAAFQQLYNSLGSAASRFAVEGFVEQLLTRKLRMEPADRKALIQILGELIKTADMRVWTHQNENQGIRDHCDRVFHNVADEPEKLIRLDGYLRRLERAIQRKVRQLSPR